MIIQSPESIMPEPYKTYVRQRSEVIGAVLQDVVGDVDVQLCPRAIADDERYFASSQAIVYGAVVDKQSHGFKSVLYDSDFKPQNRGGTLAFNELQAMQYALTQFKQGNRVRVKDVTESDGQGQHIAESLEEVQRHFGSACSEDSLGVVLMPHLAEISDRLSIGEICLKGYGSFGYIGRETVIEYNGRGVYGGSRIGLYATSNTIGKAAVMKHLDIPRHLLDCGERALKRYSHIAAEVGRASVDVIEGSTDSGQRVYDAVDVTPRVGGGTPAEVLAIREVYGHPDAVCFAASQLIYEPSSRLQTGVNFIDTDSLVINARVEEVIHE